jgi:hypothetical protein
VLSAVAGTATDQPAAVPELMALLTTKHATLHRAELGFSDNMGNILVAVNDFTMQPPMIDFNHRDPRQKHTLAGFFVDLLSDIFNLCTEIVNQLKPAFRDHNPGFAAEADGAT